MISVLEQAELRSAPQEATEELGEFEIVLGRGQVASTLLLLLVLVVVFSAGAYVVGKSTVPKTAVQVAAPIPAAAPAPVAPAAKQEPAPQAVAQVSTPLYADELLGKVYLQVGAVEKGLAAIWAEGLRTHGLEAFVAPGPSEKTWRVVIGPLPNPEAFMRTKEALERLGINTFGRKYEAPAAPAKETAPAAKETKVAAKETAPAAKETKTAAPAGDTQP